MDTLAVRLTIPPVGFVGDFHSQVRAPCRAHNKKDVALLATSPINVLPSNAKYSPSHKRNLTAEVRYRHRRASVANIADDLSAVLRFEIVIPKIIQRYSTCGRCRDQTKIRVSRNAYSDVAFVGLEFVGAAAGKLSIKEDIAHHVLRNDIRRNDIGKNDVIGFIIWKRFGF